MITNKLLCLAIYLLLGFGCAHDPNRPINYKFIKVVPGAVRTVCIQPDPSQPEMALVVKPLEEKLEARGYKIVASPAEAVHTLRLHLRLFDIFGANEEAARAVASGYKRPSGPLQGAPYKDSPLAPNVGYAAGTAIGGAASGSALHAATTTGGAVGGVAGLVVGSILSAGSQPKGPFFYADLDVRISDPVSGEQHTVRGETWQFFKDPKDPTVMKDMERLAANDLANKIAALMP
jgi:hypothetical protein